MRESQITAWEAKKDAYDLRFHGHATRTRLLRDKIKVKGLTPEERAEKLELEAHKNACLAELTAKQ